MNDQMILVISSPSSSTTGFFTLILAIWRSLVGVADAIARFRETRALAAPPSPAGADQRRRRQSEGATRQGRSSTTRALICLTSHNGHRLASPARERSAVADAHGLQPGAAAGRRGRVRQQPAAGGGGAARGRLVGERASLGARPRGGGRAAAVLGHAGQREQAG